MDVRRSYVAFYRAVTRTLAHAPPLLPTSRSRRATLDAIQQRRLLSRSSRWSQDYLPGDASAGPPHMTSSSFPGFLPRSGLQAVIRKSLRWSDQSGNLRPCSNADQRLTWPSVFAEEGSFAQMKVSALLDLQDELFRQQVDAAMEQVLKEDRSVAGSSDPASALALERVEGSNAPPSILQRSAQEKDGIQDTHGEDERMVDMQTSRELDTKKSTTPSETTISTIFILIRRGQVIQGIYEVLQRLRATSRARQQRAAKSVSDPFTNIELFEQLTLETFRFFKGPTALTYPTLDEASVWMRPAIPKTINLSQVSKGPVCTLAVSSLVDHCISRGHVPTQRMIASLMSTVSQTFSLEAFAKCALFSLGMIKGKTIQGFLMASIISGFGRLREPAAGEVFLSRWTHEHVDVLQEVPQYLLGLKLPLNGWSHHAAIWQALIQARILCGDVKGAKRWMMAYFAVRNDPSLPERVRPEWAPFLLSTLLDGASRALVPSGQRCIDEKAIVEIRDILRIAQQNSMELDSRTLASLARLSGKGQEHLPALGILRAALEGSRLGRRTDTESAYVQVEAQDKASRAPREDADCWPQNVATSATPTSGEKQMPGDRLANKRPARQMTQWNSFTYRMAFDQLAYKKSDAKDIDILRTLDPSLHKPRDLLRAVLTRNRTVHLDNLRGEKKSPLHPVVLHSSLRAFLRRGDWPAAILVLETFQRCRLEWNVTQLFSLFLDNLHLGRVGLTDPGELLSLLPNRVRLAFEQGNAKDWQKMVTLQRELEVGALKDRKHGKYSVAYRGPIAKQPVVKLTAAELALAAKESAKSSRANDSSLFALMEALLLGAIRRLITRTMKDLDGMKLSHVAADTSKDNTSLRPEWLTRAFLSPQILRTCFASPTEERLALQKLVLNRARYECLPRISAQEMEEVFHIKRNFGKDWKGARAAIEKGKKTRREKWKRDDEGNRNFPERQSALRENA